MASARKKGTSTSRSVSTNPGPLTGCRSDELTRRTRSGFGDSLPSAEPAGGLVSALDIVRHASFACRVRNLCDGARRGDRAGVVLALALPTRYIWVLN
eukprot:scaffold10314_cov33-Phaeocystis_antarctica.AAC.2